MDCKSEKAIIVGENLWCVVDEILESTRPECTIYECMGWVPVGVGATASGYVVRKQCI